jgi:hypothetical protein
MTPWQRIVFAGNKRVALSLSAEEVAQLASDYAIITKSASDTADLFTAQFDREPDPNDPVWVNFQRKIEGKPN